MHIEAGLVKKAYDLYHAGEFKQAKSVYQQLSDSLGRGLFDINMRLCDDRMSLSQQISEGSCIELEKNEQNSKVMQLEQQLAVTQQQLEYYYQRSQELALRLLDVST
ncbi:hypothetical protein [Rheinheimera soli]|uniref:Uncharacterized protein n=1 Tax=Rheinheimera soli TaxID=443616 RepID=A0ABU1VU96_9GAMM|nr:hypothetical protein [Rheinheimera soli]MDR7119296.1 hypothetical protein [Rheinheimera soli]